MSSRGFNGRLANKLQVLIDGRSVYNRGFAGVDWENQDVDLEDIDRIEVIRGSGATLWGSNAVNGVINIITKSSTQTLGNNFTAGGGSFERGFGSFRYGKKLNDNTTARAYVKGFDRSNNDTVMPDTTGYNINNASKYNNWNKQQGGFRVDSILNDRDELTIQGDIYNSTANLSTAVPNISNLTNMAGNSLTSTLGGNLLTRFQRTISPTSEFKLQMYYDAYSRDFSIFKDSRQTLDFDAQHRFLWFKNNEIVWGGNYKLGMDNVSGNNMQSFIINPSSINDHLASAFIQDEINGFNNRLKFNFGTKLEHNSYSGFEVQPSAHIMWAVKHDQRIWAGISRAVRTPSRVDQGLNYPASVVPANAVQNPFGFPVLINYIGNPNFKAENVITYEIGYRTSFNKSVSLDITSFYNQYKNLFSYIPSYNIDQNDPSYLNLNWQVGNFAKSYSYGIEAASSWQMLDWWRWDVNHTWFHNQYITSPNYISANDASPSQRSSVRGLINITKDIDFDIWWRYTDKNRSDTFYGAITTPSYFALDLRSAWRPTKNIELSITGQNLLQAQHIEFVAETFFLPTAITRSVYGQVRFKF